MTQVILFMILFTLFYFVYYFIFDDMLKKEKYAQISELTLLVKKFDLDKKKMDYKKCLNGVALINGFIISIVSVIILSIKIYYIFRLLIAFILIMVLIGISYYSYGKYLNKKWGKENGK